MSALLTKHNNVEIFTSEAVTSTNHSAVGLSSPPATTPELHALYRDLKLTIEYLPTEKLVPYARSARKHSKRQIAKITESIRAFGFVVPLIVDASDELIN